MEAPAINMDDFNKWTQATSIVRVRLCLITKLALGV